MVRAATLVVVVVSTGIAAADPDPQPAPDPKAQPSLVLQPLALSSLPTLPVPSLRLEAVRIAGERVDSDWHYPEPGALLGNDGGIWWMGYGHYHPRTARSAALHGTSIGATLVGQILMSANSPLAGIGALMTGVTLDAAAADADRDAEAKRR
jgi:hypothetical protein